MAQRLPLQSLPTSVLSEVFQDQATALTVLYRSGGASR